MESISRKFSYYLKENLNMLEEDREIMEYGLIMFLGTVFEVIMIIIISMFLGTLKYALSMCFSFVLFRKSSGGAHFSTYISCMIFSVSMFSIASKGIQLWEANTNLRILVLFIIAIIIFSVYVIICFVPSDTPNRPIESNEEKRVFKKRTSLSLITYVFLSVMLPYFKISNALILSCWVGVLLQMIFLTPKGYLFINKIDDIVNSMERRSLN